MASSRMTGAQFIAGMLKGYGLPHVLPQACREATSGTPRPVHLEFDGLMGELLERDESQLEIIVEERHRRYPSHRPRPEPGLLEEAASVLSGKYVHIIAGP